MSMMKISSDTNYVSLGNLITLVLIFASVVGAWFNLRGDVDYVKSEIAKIQQGIHIGNSKRDEAINSLRARNEALTDLFTNAQQRTIERLAIVETKMDSAARAQQRIEQQLELLLSGPRAPAGDRPWGQ